MRPLALLVSIGISCGGGKGGAIEPRVEDVEPVDAAIAASSTEDAGSEEDPSTQCATWCTYIAVCWEEVNEKEYNHGGICSGDCSDKPEAERRAFGRCVTSRMEDCPAMLEC